MAWDFTTEPEFQEKLDWMDEFVREEVEPLDLVWGRPRLPSPRRHAAQGGRSAEEAGARPRSVGLPPRPRARRRGVRAAQALAHERDPRPFAVGADHLRHPGPRHRQRRDHRPLRDRGAEGALPPAPAQRGGLLLLLHDRTPGGSDPTRFTTRARKDGDEWVLEGMEVLLLQRPHRGLPHRHGRDQPRRERLQGHVDVPGADRHARGGHRAQRRAHGGVPARGRGDARPHPLQRGATAGRQPARR